MCRHHNSFIYKTFILCILLLPLGANAESITIIRNGELPYQGDCSAEIAGGARIDRELATKACLGVSNTMLNFAYSNGVNQCAYIDNAAVDGRTASYFVPLRTFEEWTAFSKVAQSNNVPGLSVTGGCRAASIANECGDMARLPDGRNGAIYEAAFGSGVVENYRCLAPDLGCGAWERLGGQAGCQARVTFAGGTCVDTSQPPVHILMLLDASESMESFLQNVHDAVYDFVSHRVVQGADAVFSIMAFRGNSTSVKQIFGPAAVDSEVMARAMAPIPAWSGGGTPLKTAMKKAVGVLEKTPDRDKIMLVFSDGGWSDGEDPRSTMNAARSKMRFYGVAYKSSNTGVKGTVRGPAFLKALDAYGPGDNTAEIYSTVESLIADRVSGCSTSLQLHQEGKLVATLGADESVSVRLGSYDLDFVRCGNIVTTDTLVVSSDVTVDDKPCGIK